MNGRGVADRCTRGVLVCAVLFGSAATGLAGPAPFTHRATITVFADRYAVGETAFDDLDQLQKHITAARVRSVELLICGPRATRALKAIVHRFRHVPVQMRAPDVDERECTSKASLVTPVRQAVGQPPFGIDEDAVERYWLDIIP